MENKINKAPQSGQGAHQLNHHQRRVLKAIQRKADKQKKKQENKKKMSNVEAIGENGWDDLNRIYLECHAVSVSPARILPFLNDKDKLSNIKDTKSLVENTKKLSEMVTEYRKRLEDVKTLHATRSGSATDPDDLMQCISIGESYQEWLFSYQMNVQPVINALLTLFADKKEEEPVIGEDDVIVGEVV